METLKQILDKKEKDSKGFTPVKKINFEEIQVRDLTPRQDGQKIWY